MKLITIKDKEFETLKWVFYDMRYRCERSTHKAYKNYGGRGIKVCPRWTKVEYFIRDMGVRPKGFLLDRVDNNSDYCPVNCKWVDRKTQNNNRRICFSIKVDDNFLSLKQFWEKFALPSFITYRALHKRVSKGMNVWDAIKIPAAKGGVYAKIC